MHPHHAEASASSRAKLKAMTGKGGGGRAHCGESLYKRAAAGGEMESYDSHTKRYNAGKPVGRKAKGRADYARGGRAKNKDTMPPANPKISSGPTPKSFWSRQSPTPPSLEDAVKSGAISKDTTQEQWEQFSPGMRREITRGKMAKGGRAKAKGDVNVTIIAPQHGQPPRVAAGGPGAPPPQPGGMGGGAPPPGGAPPNPQLAQAAMQALGGGGGGPMGMPGGGGNPLAALGGGMPGKGPFKRGGRAKFAKGGRTEYPSNEAEGRRYEREHPEKPRGSLRRGESRMAKGSSKQFPSQIGQVPPETMASLSGRGGSDLQSGFSPEDMAGMAVKRGGHVSDREHYKRGGRTKSGGIKGGRTMKPEKTMSPERIEEFTKRKPQSNNGLTSNMKHWGEYARRNSPDGSQSGSDRALELYGDRRDQRARGGAVGVEFGQASGLARRAQANKKARNRAAGK